MQVTLPEGALPATLRLNPKHSMSDDEYFEFCMANPNVFLERTAEGEIIIVPPVGLESEDREMEVVGQLRRCAKRDGRGKGFGPTAEYILSTGAAYPHDAAWVSNERLSQLSKEQKRKFPPLCPEFVVEVMSRSDRLKDAQKKMREWIRAGVELAWLIDADERTVYMYRVGQIRPERHVGIDKLLGEGPVAGFELDLTDIWAGL
jgi:Uma2 family endonuclease